MEYRKNEHGVSKEDVAENNARNRVVSRVDSGSKDAYPVPIVDRYCDLSQATHTTTGDEGNDLAIQHPPSPSRARSCVAIRASLTAVDHQILEACSVSS